MPVPTKPVLLAPSVTPISSAVSIDMTSFVIQISPTVSIDMALSVIPTSSAVSIDTVCDTDLVCSEY